MPHNKPQQADTEMEKQGYQSSSSMKSSEQQTQGQSAMEQGYYQSMGQTGNPAQGQADNCGAQPQQPTSPPHNSGGYTSSPQHGYPPQAQRFDAPPPEHPPHQTQGYAPPPGYYPPHQAQGYAPPPPPPGYPPYQTQGYAPPPNHPPHQAQGYVPPPPPGYPPHQAQGYAPPPGYPSYHAQGYAPPPAYTAYPPGQQPGYHPAYPIHAHPNYNLGQQLTNSLSSFFDFRDERFVKGAIMGAAATFLLTNDSVQKNAVKSMVKVWNLFQGGVEEVKERFRDAEAEIKSEEQNKP